MLRNKKFMFLFTMLAVSAFWTASCKKKEKIAQKGQKCGSGIKCVKGTECQFGICEDLTMTSKECVYLRKASKGIMESDPKSLIKGVNHKIDFDYITSITDAASNIYKAFGRKLSQRQCKNIISCQLPKLGIGYAWFWTRSAYEATKQIPIGGKKVTSNPISIVSAFSEQGSMGEDESLFPKEKIKMMQKHRIGCKTKVKFRVRDNFAGFVTFHYWKNDCVYVPPKRGDKDPAPKWDCKKKGKRLDHEYYTQTIYLYPLTDAQIKAAKSKQKGKAKRDFITGNPGTYSINVWAYNPIDEKRFAEHRQWEGKELEEMKKYNTFIRCPKYGDNAFNNGCACIGFQKNKITVTTSPDPFYLPLDEEKCNKADAPKAKKK